MGAGSLRNEPSSLDRPDPSSPDLHDDSCCMNPLGDVDIPMQRLWLGLGG